MDQFLEGVSDLRERLPIEAISHQLELNSVT
jgi:hypothetical protein